MESQHEYVTDHDKAFLRTTEGRMLVVAYGIMVSEVERYLAHPSETLDAFVNANVPVPNRPVFWQRYEAARAKWAHPQV
jgi:hypothetical protein